MKKRGRPRGVIDMVRTTVYLPLELRDKCKKHKVPLTKTCSNALDEALRLKEFEVMRDRRGWK